MSSVEFQLLRERVERLYNELRIMEEQLHPVITRLRTALGEFLGVEGVSAPPTPAPPDEVEVTTRRIMVAEEFREMPPPTAPRQPTVQDLINLLLTTMLTKGIRIAPYSVHRFVEAPEPITFEGSSHDLGESYNALILVPTIDTQIEIDKPVETTTPVIKAQTAFNLDNIVVRKIFYKGVTPGLTGNMNIWAFRY